MTRCSRSFQEFAATFTTFDDFERAVGAGKLAAGAMQRLADAPDTEWAQDREAFVDVGEDGEPLRLPRSPFRFSGADAGTTGQPAWQGQHNREVLRELLGLGDDDVYLFGAQTASSFNGHRVDPMSGLAVEFSVLDRQQPMPPSSSGRAVVLDSIAGRVDIGPRRLRIAIDGRTVAGQDERRARTGRGWPGRVGPCSGGRSTTSSVRGRTRISTTACVRRGLLPQRL